jgi:hypothetical protein
VVHLLYGTILIVVGVADGDKGRVPRPLVRIELGPGLVIMPIPVEVQDNLCLLDKIVAILWHGYSLLALLSPVQPSLTPRLGAKTAEVMLPRRETVSSGPSAGAIGR